MQDALDARVGVDVGDEAREHAHLGGSVGAVADDGQREWPQRAAVVGVASARSGHDCRTEQGAKDDDESERASHASPWVGDDETLRPYGRKGGHGVVKKSARFREPTRKRHGREVGVDGVCAGRLVLAEEPVAHDSEDKRPQQELVEVLDVLDRLEKPLVGPFPDKRIGDDDCCAKRCRSQ